MPRHQPRSESPRTEFDGLTAGAAFAKLDEHTEAFSDALRLGRCRKSGRFDAHLGSTVGVLDPIVGAWRLEILFALLVDGPQRFNALKARLRGVSARVLTDQLRALERADFIAREPMGAAVAYALAPHGRVVARHLHPILFYLRNKDSIPSPFPGRPARGV